MPVIYCNGAGIYDLNKDREIATFPISHELVYDIQKSLAKLLSEREECRIKLSPITNGVYFKHKSHSENARDKCKIAYMKDNLYEIMSAKEWEEHHIHKFIFGGEVEAVRNIRKYLDPIYGDMSAMSQASAAYCECNGKGVSKATGIANMLKLCFGDKKMTLCVVGDFDNDIEMLKSSDYGFCPENANDKVKAVCHKCLCHHNKGVIADVIEYIDKNLI